MAMLGGAALAGLSTGMGIGGLAATATAAGMLGTAGIGAGAMAMAPSVLSSMAPAALAPAMAPMVNSPAWLSALSAGQGFSSMGGQYGLAPSMASMVGGTPPPPTNWFKDIIKDPAAQRALGGLGAAGLAALFEPDPVPAPRQQWYPYPPPTDFESRLTGEITESAVERLQREFAGLSDLAKYSRENIREKVLPFIFDADPTQDALQNFLPGSRTEFDRLKRAAETGFRTIDDYLLPYAESQRDLMGQISPRMEALAPRMQEAALDPYSLSPTAASTIGDIELAARNRLQLLEDVERQKVMERAQNVFGPDADLNVYLTQMMDPFARQTSIGRAQLEEALGQQRLQAGLGATTALGNIYGQFGNQYNLAGQRYLQGLGQVPGVLQPIASGAGQVLGLRQNLLNRGLDIKQQMLDYNRVLAGAFDPTKYAVNLANLRRGEIKPLDFPPAQEAPKSKLAEIFGGAAPSLLKSAADYQVEEMRAQQRARWGTNPSSSRMDIRQNLGPD